MGISTLLLNTFIIIICILSYHVFWLEFKEKTTCNNILFSILSSIAIIFCMTFPFHLHVGFIYDLRFIPIILVFLYGNTKNIVFIGILYLSYRFYLGGNGVLPSFIIFTIIFGITMLFRYLLPMYVKEKKSIIKLTPYFSMYNFTFYLRYCNSNTYRRENRLYSHRIFIKLHNH